jgi:hypothetical protein
VLDAAVDHEEELTAELGAKEAEALAGLLVRVAAARGLAPTAHPDF